MQYTEEKLEKGGTFCDLVDFTIRKQRDFKNKLKDRRVLFEYNGQNE